MSVLSFFSLIRWLSRRRIVLFPRIPQYPKDHPRTRWQTFSDLATTRCCCFFVFFLFFFFGTTELTRIEPNVIKTSGASWYRMNIIFTIEWIMNWRDIYLPITNHYGLWNQKKLLPIVLSLLLYGIIGTNGKTEKLPWAICEKTCWQTIFFPQCPSRSISEPRLDPFETLWCSTRALVTFWT